MMGMNQEESKIIDQIIALHERGSVDWLDTSFELTSDDHVADSEWCSVAASKKEGGIFRQTATSRAVEGSHVAAR